MRYVWTDGALKRKWSKPVTVRPPGGAGHVLVHMAAGSPGRLGFAYFDGVPKRAAGKPAWYLAVAQTQNGLARKPKIRETLVSKIPTYDGTASELMGACGSGPAQGVENGFACDRSTDVWGIALDRRCSMMVAWPTVKNKAKGTNPGTFVSTQKSGPRLCGKVPKKKKRRRR